MIEVLSGMPDDVVAVAAHGKVTGNDYDSVLVPAIERKLETRKKIRFYYELRDDFSGYTTEAIWDDAKVGLRRWSAFEKVAVVTEVSWVMNAIRAFRFLLPCPVKIFRNDESAAAKAWLLEA